MVASSISLRPYRPSDFETLYQIDQGCFRPGIAYGRFELKVYLALKGSHCLVAEARRHIAAFIVTSLTHETCHIITIDVLESHRRLGIGSRLLRAAEAGAASRGARRMVLETATDNKAAIAFWGKHGYRELGILRDYYGTGLNAFEMEKRLKAPAP